MSETTFDGFLDEDAADPRIKAVKISIANQWILAGFGTTDSEVARRFTEQAATRIPLRYSPDLGWFHWNGIVWESVSRDAARGIVRTEMTGIISCFKARAEAEHLTCPSGTGSKCTERCETVLSQYKSLKRYESAAAFSGVITELSTRPETIVDDPALFDAHPHLLNCRNGVVNLTDGTLHPANPDWLMTRVCAAEYHPDAEHADWTQALDALSPLDAEAQDWLHRYLGSGASGHTLPDSLNVFLHGNGANGKSTILEGVMTALGGYADLVPEAAIASGSNYEQKVAMLAFRGLRFALLDETADDMRLATTAIKKLTNPVVSARVLNKGNVNFPASHTLAIATNHQPYVKEADAGTWRRLVMVPFRKDYRKEPVFDKTLRERIVEGADGRAEAVLAWLVAGCRAWYADARTLTPVPAELQNVTNEWREDTDLLGQFITDELNVTGGTSFASKAQVWATFQHWCNLNGHKNPYGSQRGFNTSLKGHEAIASSGVDANARGTGGVKGWAGLTLRSLGHSSVTVDTTV